LEVVEENLRRYPEELEMERAMWAAAWE